MNSYKRFDIRGAARSGGIGNNTTMGGIGNPQTTQPSMFSREGMFGDSGWFMPSLQGIMGGANLFLGMQNYRQGRRAYRDSQEWANRNWERQTDLLNEYRQDRQAARHAYDPERYAPTVQNFSGGSTQSQPSPQPQGQSNDFSTMRQYRQDPNRRGG